MKNLIAIKEAMTNLDSLTLYGINLTAWSITLLNIEDTAKVVLLLASIVFTIVKTVDVVKNWVSYDKQKDK